MLPELRGIDINSCMVSDFSKFDCGNEGLNNYLINDASKDTASGFNNTTVFFDKKGKLVGYYSIQTSLFSVNEFKDQQMLSDEYPIANEYMEAIVTLPSVHVNNFAVDKKYQRKGFGAKMMFKLFYSLYLMRVSTNIAVSLLTLESVEDSEDFYKHFGFEYAHKDYDVVDMDGSMYPYPMLLKFSFIIEAIDELNIKFNGDPFSFLRDLN